MGDNDVQYCGCPTAEYHLADCTGSPAYMNTKEYWLNVMEQNGIDYVDMYDDFDE